MDQPIESMRIEGFIPVIINVTPGSLPMILGLNSFDSEVPITSAVCPSNASGNANCSDSVMPMIKPDEEILLGKS